MGAATRITWTEHTADELLDLARDCRDAKQAARARAVAMILEGASRTEAARAQGMDLQILRDWVLRYNAEGFEAQVTSRLRPEALAGPVEIWFQDEARVGQKGMTTRVWARGKRRPRIVRDYRYGCVWLFGATCAARGVGIGHVAERANTASMNEHLAAIGAAVAPGAHGVVVLDGAGWHRPDDLVVPRNLTLVQLPPYSPELNPMEQIVLFLKSNRFANRVFRDVAALKEACRAAWQWLTDQPDVITKTTRRS